MAYISTLVIGPSVLRAPAEQTKVATVFVTFFHMTYPAQASVIACAAKRHSLRDFFFLLPPLFKTTEGVVVLFQIFACGPELPIE